MRQLFLFCGLLFAISSVAQDIDQQRMKRDIEVAENIISTLFEQGKSTSSSSYLVRSEGQVEGNYLDGYGIIFSTNQTGAFAIYTEKSKGKSNGSIAVSPAPSVYTLRGSGVVVRGYNDATDEETRNKLDSIQSEKVARFKIVAQQFFTDYAYLIGQLQPTEKIMLRNDGRRSNSFNATSFFGSSSAPNTSVSAEITVKDMLDFRAGKLTKEKFEQRIKFVETSGQADVSTDIKLVASVFERLYDRDLSQQFMRVGNCNYQVLEGLGAIYALNFSDDHEFPGLRQNVVIFGDRQVIEDDGEIIVEGKGENENDETEPDEDYDEALYEDFIDEFKTNMIEYGRLAKSLNDEELLIFRIHFNGWDCDNCLQNPELSVKAKVLKDFDRNALKLEEAVSQIKVSKQQ